ncbi:MAG: hypothetical protein AB7K09_19490 [Planctomycetota bacterium]
MTESGSPTPTPATGETPATTATTTPAAVAEAADAPPASSSLALWIGGIVVSLVVIALMYRPLNAFDAGWNVRLGESRLLGLAPDDTHDPLIYAPSMPTPVIGPGAPNVPDERVPVRNAHWFGQIIMWWLYSSLGLAGLTLMRAVCMLIALVCVYRITRRLGAPAGWAWFAVGMVVPLIDMVVAERPSAFSVAFAAVSALLWVKMWDTGRARWGWIAVVLLPVWIQLHAAIFFGVLIAGAWIVGLLVEQLVLRKPLSAPPGQKAQWWQREPPVRPDVAPGMLIALGVAALALPTLADPDGPGNWIRLLLLLANAPYPHIILSTEFGSADVKDLPNLFLVVLPLLVLTLPWIWRRLPAAALIGAVGGVAAAMIALRSMFMPAVLSVPVIVSAGCLGWSALLQRHGHDAVRIKPGHAWLPMMLACVVATGFFGWRWINDYRPSAGYAAYLPNRIAEYIQADPPPGRAFNVFWHGGTLELLAPDVTWCVDGRLWNMRQQYSMQYALSAPRAGNPPLWQQLFAHYRVDFAVLPLRHRAPLVDLCAAMGAEPGWYPAMLIDGNILMVRLSAPQAAAWLARRGQPVPQLRDAIGNLVNQFVGQDLVGQPYSHMIGAQFLLLGGYFDEARDLLISAQPSDRSYQVAQAVLAQWDVVRLFYAQKLALLPGGEAYANIARELEARGVGRPVQTQPAQTQPQ